MCGRVAVGITSCSHRFGILFREDSMAVVASFLPYSVRAVQASISVMHLTMCHHMQGAVEMQLCDNLWGTTPAHRTCRGTRLALRHFIRDSTSNSGRITERTVHVRRWMCSSMVKAWFTRVSRYTLEIQTCVELIRREHARVD